MPCVRLAIVCQTASVFSVVSSITITRKSHLLHCLWQVFEHLCQLGRDTASRSPIQLVPLAPPTNPTRAKKSEAFLASLVLLGWIKHVQVKSLSLRLNVDVAREPWLLPAKAIRNKFRAILTAPEKVEFV